MGETQRLTFVPYMARRWADSFHESLERFTTARKPKPRELFEGRDIAPDPDGLGWMS